MTGMLRQLRSRHHQASRAAGLAHRELSACWQRVNACGGQPQPLTAPEGFDSPHRFWLPSVFGSGGLFGQERPLCAEAQRQPHIYTLDIVTGDVRGAGTKVRLHSCQTPDLTHCERSDISSLQSPALVRLVGVRGESEEFFVGACVSVTRSCRVPL